MKYIITYYDEDNHLCVKEFYYAYNPTDAICQFEQCGLGHQEDIISIVRVG